MGDRQPGLGMFQPAGTQSHSLGSKMQTAWWRDTEGGASTHSHGRLVHGLQQLPGRGQESLLQKECPTLIHTRHSRGRQEEVLGVSRWLLSLLGVGLCFVLFS